MPLPHTIRCRACGDTRPLHLVKVSKFDESSQWGLPEGTLVSNFQHCADRDLCVARGKNFTGYKIGEK